MLFPYSGILTSFSFQIQAFPTLQLDMVFEVFLGQEEGRVLANRRLLRGKSPGTARKLRESGAREQIPDSQGQLSVCASG